MDDLEFLQRCFKGDETAWCEFIEKYSRLIYNYIHSVLKIKGVIATRQNTADIFQEIFLSLTKDNFKKLRTFKAKNGCTLATWLRQVTINHTIDYLRKIRPTVSIDVEIDEGLNLQDVLTDNSENIHHTLNNEERLVYLKDCIQRLDNEDKYFLELYINQGLTLEELKGHFKVSRGAIDMRRARIIERLRDCFKNKGFKLDFSHSAVY